MNTSDHSKSNRSKGTKFVPLWAAYPLALFAWWLLPWIISLLMPHYGWIGGRPVVWNLLGLIPVLVGTVGLIWGMALHAAESTEGINFELDKDYLLRRGPYGFSRNPMYVAELILLLGWILFYGSVALVVALIAWYMFFNYYQIPLEERTLEAHFGESYREYKSRVRCWFGRI